MTAMSIMQSLEKLGLQIPGDIMIAGFDNLSKVMLVPNSITEELKAKDIFGLEALTELRREKGINNK